MNLRRFFVVLPLLWISPALACLNDRDSDSLAIQAQKFPDTLRVITGRFERNPPLFYQMRIRHSLAQLKKNPRDFGLYDDIAVAYDKLHKDDEALQIMAKKRALLPPFDAKNARLKEAWYRYYANAGTFRAHRFLSANPQKIKEMQTARDFIKRAIQIKPNAHFGREKYQLMAMEWILATKTKKTDKSLGEWVYERENWHIYEGGEGATDTYEKGVLIESKPGHKADSPAQRAQKIARQRQAVEGFSGLVVLGAAWQSVDIFHALAGALDTEDAVTLRYMALLRCGELLKNGHKSLGGVTSEDVQDTLDEGAGHYVGINNRNQPTLNKLFSKLRAEADNWNTQRQNYMMARLEKDDHPDTNPKFWNNWKPAAPPSLKVNWVDDRQQTRNVLWAAGITVWIVGIFGLGIMGLLVRRLFKRHRMAR